MAHGIMQNDSMMYFGETPWHGLGTQVDHALTSSEAIIASGLDWEVVKVPLQTRDYEYTLSNGEVVNFGGIENNEKFDMIRSDTMENIGTVGGRYEPLQNVQAFEFFDSIVGAKEAMYHTAGSLFNGRKIWLLAKLPEFLRINNTDDLVEEFMLLATSHDGSTAVVTQMTPIRVVCNNTLSAALDQGSKYKMTVRHTPTMSSKIAVARKALGFAKEYFVNLGDVLNEFARYEVNEKQVTKFVEDLFPITPSRVEKAEEMETEATAATRTINNRNRVIELFETGKGNSEVGIKGTVYALYNGATEYVDWCRGTKANEDAGKDDQRLDAVWFGSGAKLKEDSFDLCKKLVGVK